METRERKRERLTAKLARLQGQADPLAALSKSFHLGMVGGSGRNVAALNRKREASLGRTIKTAVEIQAVTKELGYLNAAEAWERGAEQRDKIRTEVRCRMTELGRQAASSLKPGDKVMWVQSDSPLRVIRVNKTSVTVEMCGGQERLLFSEIRPVAS